jgi:hypothetical protein
MALYQCYTWEFRIEVPPYDRLPDVVEAFFSSYPAGDYACEKRERYKLEFRRGQWKRLLAIGPLVPARLVPGCFQQWPIVVRVLIRPSPETFLITARYELHVPRSIKSLTPQVQSSVAQHAEVELEELAEYLAECIRLEQRPRIEMTR